MALNPYTLYHLYEKGILEYVPADLAAGVPVSPMMQMSNPYLDMAQQGGLYQSHGMHNDSFQFSVNPVQSQPQIGSLSQTGGMNTFNGTGIGAYSQAGGENTFGGVGIGAYSQTGSINTFGGFADTQNNIINGYYKTKSIIDRTPKFVLGLAAAGIGILGLKAGFGRFGKKAAKKTSFLSKLNPFNWKLFSKKS